MWRRKPFLVLLPFAVLLWGGCDIFSNDSVRGRVVDADTGRPVDVGDVNVKVYGPTPFDVFPNVLGEGPAARDGSFSFSDLESNPIRVEFRPSGQIDYPGLTTTGRAAERDVFRDAYYDLNMEAESNLGTVEVLPTCTTLGTVSSSRPVAFDEFLVLQMVSVPDLPSRPGSETTVYQRDGLDSIRLLAIGGREARLEWTLRGRNEVQEVRAAGVIELPSCPRHEVLAYQATLTF